MEAHVRKWGNSLALRIPSAFSHQLHLNPGSLVDMTIEGDSLVIRTISYSLDEMLSQINENNLHSQMLDGSQVGNEEW